jgi:MFS family permease
MGRRVPIAISAIFILGPAIGSGCCNTWWQLLICRFLLGLGMGKCSRETTLFLHSANVVTGCKAAVVPVYAAEIAPSHLRGSLIMNWQLVKPMGRRPT